MSDAKTYSPFVIELHNKDIAFQLYDPKKDGLVGGRHAHSDGANSKTNKDPLSVLKILKNPTIRGFYKLAKVRWDDNSRGAGAGLNNPGINVCYMNVIIQVISHTPFLASSLLKSFHTRACANFERNIFCIMCLFEKYVKESFAAPNPLNNPFYPVAKRFIWPRFKPGHQDDAFIFLKHFLDSLSRACYLNDKAAHEARGAGREPSDAHDFISNDKIMSTVIGRLFGGYFRNVIICDNCAVKSEKVEEFFDVAVDVSKSDRLVDLLSDFVLPEKLTTDNRYFCTECKGYQNATKSLSILKAPRILNVNLKRFNPNSTGFKKSLKEIHFPPALSIALTPEEGRSVPLHYDLYAIVCHIGKSLNMGHYITYIRGKHGFWQCFDDSAVRTASVERVLRNTSDVYLLFYAINNESVEACDSVLNTHSYTNEFRPEAQTEDELIVPDFEGESYAPPAPEAADVDILSSFGPSSILKRFISHKKFKNFKLLKIKLFSTLHKLRLLRASGRYPAHAPASSHGAPSPLFSGPDRECARFVDAVQKRKIRVSPTSDSIADDTTESRTDSGTGLSDPDLSNRSRDIFKGPAGRLKRAKRGPGPLSDGPGPSPLAGETVEVWSDAEDVETYERLYKELDPDPPRPSEHDAEYDRGKPEKVRTRRNAADEDAPLVSHRSGAAVKVAQKNLFDSQATRPKRPRNNIMRYFKRASKTH